MRDQHELMLGEQEIQRFGNYDLVHRIAIGGMGEVYLARQRTAFGREVAVKIIRSDLVHDMTARQRFLREAEVNAYLKHDHILSLVEFGEQQGRLFLVTPYIKGGTLLKRLQIGSLSLAEVYQLFTALVEAVAYLHKRGVIHRDLKPSNILLDCAEDSNRIYVRLIDFGIATLQGLSASAPLTMAGHEMGTVAYMAPERLDGVAAPSNDIYSLGIILYQMITGQLPNAGEMASLPRPLSYVIGHCIITNPQQRFASADDLLTSFEQAYQVVKNSYDVNGPYVAPKRSTVPLTANLSNPQSLSGDFAASSSFESVTIVQPNRRAIREEPEPSSSPPFQTATPDNLAAIPRPEIILPPLPGSEKAFTGEDYSAPTSSLDPVSLGKATSVNVQNPVLASNKRSRNNRLLIAPIIALILVMLISMGTLGYQAFQASVLANITVSPRVQTISTVFRLTARLGLKSVSVASSSIPARVFTSTQESSQQGETTGITHCIFDIINCQQAVSLSDIEMLSSQIRPTLHSKIDQDLQKQAHDANATIIGNTMYSNEIVTPNPSAGTASKSVTVTMTEQGSIEYIKAKDVNDLAILLLKQKFNQHYQLIDSLVQIGQPVTQPVNTDGTAQIVVAAGGVARYQMPASELADIRNHIKGLPENNAHAQIAKDANIDPNGIGIHLSYGNNIPNNVQQIKIQTINPSNLPTVELTPLSSP